MREPIASANPGTARYAGLVVARFPREVDIGCAPDLRQRMLDLLGQGALALAADLTYTRFCDCSGLNAVLGARARASELGIAFGLVLPRTGTVWKVFYLSGVSETIPNAPTLDDLVPLLNAIPVPTGASGG